MRMKQFVWPLHEVGDRAKGLVLNFLMLINQKPCREFTALLLARSCLKMVCIKLIMMLPFLIHWVMQDWGL